MPESTLPLNKIAHKELLGAHNVLAFSGGVDSSALFFTLLAYDIPFDVAFVNYHTRPSSDLEEAYAKTLCQTYHKQCHVFHAPPIEHNFEATAREIRYAFFVDILARYAYQDLITAHQLNDRFEWFLMRFSAVVSKMAFKSAFFVFSPCFAVSVPVAEVTFFASFAFCVNCVIIKYLST